MEGSFISLHLQKNERYEQPKEPHAVLENEHEAAHMTFRMTFYIYFERPIMPAAWPLISPAGGLILRSFYACSGLFRPAAGQFPKLKTLVHAQIIWQLHLILPVSRAVSTFIFGKTFRYIRPILVLILRIKTVCIWDFV